MLEIKEVKEEVRTYDPKKILCQQLELLAECSKGCDYELLAPITDAMVSIYEALNSSSESAFIEACKQLKAESVMDEIKEALTKEMSQVNLY